MATKTSAPATFGMDEALKTLGINSSNSGTSTGLNWTESSDSPMISSYSPVDGKLIATVREASASEYEQVMN
ncbi:MAG: aldehyde dehydrogenase family protein, partial [Bacteroidota bacterium]